MEFPACLLYYRYEKKTRTIIDFEAAIIESNLNSTLNQNLILNLHPKPIVRWHDTEYEVIYMRDISMERVNQTREAMVAQILYESLSVCNVTGQFTIVIDNGIDRIDNLRCR